MALNPTNFESYFNNATTGLYRDGQGAGAVTPEDHRLLVSEIKESFHNTQEVAGASFSVEFGIINLLETNFPQVIISDTISADLTVTITGDSFKPSFTFIMPITGTPVITFPSTFKSTDVRWNSTTKTFTPLEAGTYKAKVDWSGSNWLIDFSIPYN